MANFGGIMDQENSGMNINSMSMLAKVPYSTLNRRVVGLSLKSISGNQKRNVKYTIPDVRTVLSKYVKDKFPVASNKKVHCFYNFKGGTGKTSMCYQMATHLALSGYNILVVDTDQQGNTTTTLGYHQGTNYPTLYDGIMNNLSTDELILNVFEGLDLIPANFSLVHLERGLRDRTRREFVIEKYLSGLKSKYDFIIFDCNPSVSYINRNILSFSNIVNLVTETHPYSLSALPIVISDAQSYFDELGQEMPEILIIPNKYEDRSNTSVEAMSALIQHWGQYIEENFAIRKSEDFLKSARDHLPISFFCKSNSIALEDISDLMHIIIKKSKASENLFNEVA